MTGPDDLINRCQAGDPAAFNELFRDCEERVFRLAAAILRDDREAEDAMQDVFLRVFQNIRRYRAEAAFNTWLTAIVVNVCRSWLRRERLRRAVALDWLREREGASAPDPADEVHERWWRQSLWAQVDQMDDRYRLPLLLVYQEGLTVQETAQVLDCPLSTIYSRLKTGLDQLRGLQARLALGEPGKGGEKEC